MTVEIYQQYQETVEAAANIICQLKQRDDQMDIYIIIFRLKKGNDNLAIPAVYEVSHVSSYPERRQIRRSWHNTRQSICLRNMKMKKCFPLLNVGFLSAL